MLACIPPIVPLVLMPRFLILKFIADRLMVVWALATLVNTTVTNDKKAKNSFILNFMAAFYKQGPYSDPC